MSGAGSATRRRRARGSSATSRRRTPGALGGAWWVWKQACGDPHVVGYPGASGSLNPTECPSGRPLGLVTGYTDLLRRAYPRFAPGRLTELRVGLEQRRVVAARRARATATAASRSGCRATASRTCSGRASPTCASSAAPGGWLASALRPRRLRAERRARRRPRRRHVSPAAALPLTPPHRHPRARPREAGPHPRRPPAEASGAASGGIVLDLRGAPKGRIVVRIRLRGGRVERRVYRTCLPNPRRSARPGGR